jgi:gliding motility-associated-like protein
LKEKDPISSVDSLFKETFTNASAPVPPGVWEGVSAGIGSGATGMAVATKWILAKWVAGIVAVSAISVVAYQMLNVQSSTILNGEEVVQVDENVQESPVQILDTEKEFETEAAAETTQENTTANRIENKSKSDAAQATTHVADSNNPSTEIEVKKLDTPPNQVSNIPVPNLTVRLEEIKKANCLGEITTLNLQGELIDLPSVQWWLNGKIVATAKAEQSFRFATKGRQDIEVKFLQLGNWKKVQKSIDFAHATLDFSGACDEGQLSLMASEDVESATWFVNEVQMFSSTLGITYPCMQNEKLDVVMIAVSQNGCVDTIEKQITCSWNEKITVNAPNFFSPYLRDGSNDDFEIVMPKVEAYRLEIRDQAGRIVFETINQEEVWNGKHMNVGQMMPEAWYTYFLQYRDAAELKQVTGKVMLAK